MKDISSRALGVTGRVARVLLAVLAAGALLPSMALGQTAPTSSNPGAWRYELSVYGYLPTIGGSTSFPVDPGGSINVSAKQILDKLKMTAMGTFGAHNGTWGVTTDLLYVDLGDSRSNSRDFTIGNIGIPAGTTANLDWDSKSTVWTLAGEYRLATQPGWTADVLAGVRLLDLRQRLGWSITGDLGPISPLARTGTLSLSKRVWDGIVGLKARYVFGANREWSMPLYVDVGTGGSASTYQLAAGFGYRYSWGELTGVWRYLGYHAKSGQSITDVSFNGPQVGAVFRW